jgi:TRAP-type mannitol/chloroaromatic compound transport system permease small subunit
MRYPDKRSLRKVDRSLPAWSLKKKSPDPGEDKTALLVGFVRLVSGLNRIVGEVLSWLSLAVVLVCFTVVVQRYVFHYSILALQDLYVWLSGAMFTGVAGFAMLRDNLVRVDIFYRPASIRWKDFADMVGVVIFLIPFVTVITLYALPYVERSWRLSEGSANVGGMPGLFVLNSFVLVFTVLVGLQGLAWLVRSILVLMGQEDRLPENLRYPRDHGQELPS